MTGLKRIWPWVAVAVLMTIWTASSPWWTTSAVASPLIPMAQIAQGQVNAADPLGTYGAVQCLTSATLIPAAAINMNGRAGIGLYNLGPNTIYIGYDSSVTTSTGWPVPTNGSLTLALSWNKAVSAQQVYCIAATASQIAPADTRWMQLR